jgi:hypothetical protein
VVRERGLRASVWLWRSISAAIRARPSTRLNKLPLGANPTTREALLTLNTVGIVGFVGSYESIEATMNEGSAHFLRPLRCNPSLEVLSFGTSRKPSECPFSL